MMTESLMVVGPLLIVAVGGLAMMLVDAFSTQKAELSIVSAVILLGAAAMSLGLWFGGPEATAPGIIGSYLAYDGLAHFLDLVICGSTAVASLLAGGYLREHRIERGEYYVILLFSAFGAMALARAADIITLFIALETLSLGVYGLVAFRRASPRSAEAAVKYFLLGSFASAILLFGMALLYGATGLTNLQQMSVFIRNGAAPPALVFAGMLLTTVGMAFKVGAVPFHAWAPDAYQGAVTPATTYMAVVVKAAVFGAMIRLLVDALGDLSIANDSAGWPPALLGLSVITLVVGNVAALVQKDVKRMLAYSSISHAGFLLLGMVAAWKLGGGLGVRSVLFYLAGYAVSNLLAFGSLIAAGSYGKEATSYEDLAGLGRRHPWLAIPFSLGILSLMGFPPTAGFFAKYYVILAAVQGGGALLWVAVIAVLASAVGAYYYLRVLVYLFMKQPEKDAPVAVPMASGYVVAALVMAGYFVVRMGLTPGAYLALAADHSHHDANLDWTVFLIDAGVAVVGGAIAAAIHTMRRREQAGEAAPEVAG
ncbi:MAG: NADH-quinone oxidoreductase subunit N [Sandaracinaceae bacterium]|nr:NADH-quinone oxidoreductase subunit N [Sandaracinaceae bacterium]